MMNVIGTRNDGPWKWEPDGLKNEDIVIIGDSGTGKTVLQENILNRVCKTGQTINADNSTLSTSNIQDLIFDIKEAGTTIFLHILNPTHIQLLESNEIIPQEFLELLPCLGPREAVVISRQKNDPVDIFKAKVKYIETKRPSKTDQFTLLTSDPTPPKPKKKGRGKSRACDRDKKAKREVRFKF